MSQPALNLALGRVLIAAAWADGQLDPQEHEALETLLFRLPELDASEWRSLSADLDRTQAPDDFEARLQELRAAVNLPEQRELARARVAQLQREWNGAELDALQHVLQELEDKPAATGGLWNRLKRSITEPLQSQAARLQNHLQREQTLRTGLQARVEATWPEGESLPAPETLHHLCVGAAILAHVVHLDDEVDPGEVDALRQALVEQWGLSAAEAVAVADTAVEAGRDGFDLYALLREFFEHSDEPERQRFLAAVFQVAAGDGKATYDEIEEVRRIGRGLLLSHRDFISAKLQLPEDERAT